MHAKHQSMNSRAPGGNGSSGQMANNSNSMLNTSGNNNLTQSPSTVLRNKKNLFRMVKK